MSSKLVELDLFARNASAGEHAAILASLVDRLTQCLADDALDGGEAEATDFRRRINAFRAMLAGGPEPGTLQAAAADVLARCERHFASVQDYLVARDAEFSVTIDLLRSALAKVAGDTRGVNEALDDNTRKLKGLNDLTDIRHIRRELSRAVLDLETVVEEKKKIERANHEKLAKQIAQLESKVEESMAEALKDPLTAVGNRRGFDRVLRRWVSKAARSGTSFALAMIDIDDFKRINDAHGHSIGDRILTLAARCVRNGIRTSDYVARYGGEEFVVMLRDIDLDRAEQRMSEILRTIAAARYEYHGVGRTVVVTFSVSCGVTAYVAGEPGDRLVGRADGALYEAKALGKNRVVVSPAAPHGADVAAAS